MTKNQFIHLAVINATDSKMLFYDDFTKVIQEIIELADEVEKVAPFDVKNPKPTSKEQSRGLDTILLFEDFWWKDEGATRSEIEKYIKAKTGYTSNRSMQTIINNAISKGAIHKDEQTHKYFRGPSA